MLFTMHHQRPQGATSSLQAFSRRAQAAAAALAVLVAATACSGSGAEEGEAARTLTLGLDSGVTSWDPSQLSGFGADFLRWQPLFDTLVRQRPDGTVEPNAAESFSYDDDQTELTMTLREGMEFEDGEPLDAATVVANFEDRRDSTSPAAGTLAGIEIEAMDDLAFTFTLPAPDPAFLQYLTGPAGALISPKALGTKGAATDPVSSGAYTLDQAKSVSGTTLVFDKREDYWNADDFPYEEIVMRVLPDETARLNALKSGQVDAAPVTAATASEVEASGLELLTNTLSWIGLVTLDRGAKVPALGEVEVRQAMNMVFDRQAIVDSLLKGRGTVTNQIFNPDSPGYVEDLVEQTPFDVEAAEELMAEAGYADGFTVQMPVAATNAHLMPIVAQQLGLIDIEVEEVHVPLEQVVTRIFGGEFPLLALPFGTSTPYADIEKLEPESPFNISKATDEELTPLIEQAMSAQEPAEVEEVFQAISARLVELGWFVPWAFADNLYATDDSVSTEPFLGQQMPPLYSFEPAG